MFNSEHINRFYMKFSPKVVIFSVILQYVDLDSGMYHGTMICSFRDIIKNRNLYEERSITPLFLIPRLRYCATSCVQSIFMKGQKLQLAALIPKLEPELSILATRGTLCFRYIDNTHNIRILL